MEEPYPLQVMVLATLKAQRFDSRKAAAYPIVGARQCTQNVLQVDVGQIEEVGLRGGSRGGHRGGRGELAGNLLSSVEERAGCCLLITSRSTARQSFLPSVSIGIAQHIRIVKSQLLSPPRLCSTMTALCVTAWSVIGELDLV